MAATVKNVDVLLRFPWILFTDFCPPFLPPLLPPSTISWKRQWHATPVLLPGKSYGWRSRVGYSPWGRKELDTERLHFHFSLPCIGEGNGNPLQCSCLENPRDGGAWWAAVYGVSQSQTWPKWLSSRSSSNNFPSNSQSLQILIRENPWATGACLP